MAYLPVIDESACVAQGDCAEIAPEIFEVRDEVSVVLRPATLSELRDAVQACPTEAIVLLDEQTGDEVGLGDEAHL